MLEKDRQRPNSASACEHINKALAYANHNWSWDERETLADMLLLGWIDSSGNHRYFKKGSREERTARSAVAYLLRHPERLGWWTSHRVADVFDPSSLYARDISFGFRREGKPGTRIRHRQIARDMLRTVRNGNTVNEAVNAAMTKYGFPDERQVRAIWARYGKPWLED